MIPAMMQMLPMLLGENAFGGPGGPGGLGPVESGPAVDGAGGSMASLGKLAGAIAPPQGTKPQFSGGVSGTQLPFLQRVEDIINPALNASATRQANQPQLPTFAQLLSGGR